MAAQTALRKCWRRRRSRTRDWWWSRCRETLGIRRRWQRPSDHVTGDMAVLMDGDLQDPPEAVPTLLEWFEKGYDVVYVRRIDRKESWWLRACYYVFYRLFTALSALQLPFGRRRFWTNVAPGSGSDPTDAGTSSLSPWYAHLGGLSPDRSAGRTRRSSCRSHQSTARSNSSS
jgi:hypothetical protein